MNKRERVQARLKELQEQLDFLETHKGDLRKLDDVTDLEKRGAFNQLFEQCYSHVQRIIDEGYADEDSEHYIYETVMTLTLGKDIWELINAHL